MHQILHRCYAKLGDGDADPTAVAASFSWIRTEDSLFLIGAHIPVRSNAGEQFRPERMHEAAASST